LQPNGAIKYWKVHAEFLFRTPYQTTNERAWWARVRHEGYRERLANGSIANAVDNLQHVVSKPVMLDASGFQIFEGRGIDAHWLEFQKYTNVLSYSALGLF